MSRRRIGVMLGLAALPALLGLKITPLLADEAQVLAPPENVQRTPGEAVRGGGGGGKEDGLRFPKADEVTKGMQAMEGLFTLYRYPKSDKKHDPEKLLAKIPRNLLGEDLLLAVSISRGRMAGWTWDTTLFRWEVAGKYLRLVTPDTRFILKKNKPITDVVERTYNESFLAAVPIAGMSPQGDVIIDLGRLLKSDLARVPARGGRVNPDLSTWVKVKTFPDNVLVEADLAVGGSGGGSKVGMAYSFRRLPPKGSYEPRVADQRVGYFLTAKQDWTKKYNAPETFDRYIHRWKLEKQDPSLELSPPKQPIVFIIEKTVPIQWRRWVRAGIEEWNKAFEKIGFVDAIVVQQQTEDNEYADYDPEDARYNFIRWGVTGRAFAMGPSRVDPRTGQILDADILFDDSFVRAWMYNFDLYGPEALAQLEGPGFRAWLEEQPGLAEALFPNRLDRAVPTVDEEEESFWREMESRLHEQGHCLCSYAWGMQQQLALAYYTALATGTGKKKLPERFIGEAIQEIVTHEVGHTLGLRHNFKGSSWLDLDEIIRRRNETDEPTTASVMDYNPLLFFPGDKIDTVRHFISPTLGPYDEWAIAYGYAVPKKGQSEKEMLAEIASRGTERALNYATDEDTLWVISPDPLVNRYDLSSDPIAYAEARVALTGELLKNIADWALQKGEPRYYLTRAYNAVWYERVRNLGYVSRLVGGQYFHRDLHGDPNARPAFELVPPAQQRAALDYLARTIFSDDFFMLDADLLNMLAPSRWSHWGSSAPDRLDYPIHDRIRSMQSTVLLNLLAAPVLQRIYDAELKTTDPDKFTAAEYLQRVRDMIWQQLDRPGGGPYTDAQPFISSVSRNLQRDYLMTMLNMARSRPGSTVSKDLHAMIRLTLRELADRIGDVLEKEELDFASRAHLTECRSRIERTLEAPFQGQ